MNPLPEQPALSSRPEAWRAADASLLLAAIVESSDDAIISMDLQGVITSWNRGAELLYGHSAAEAIGRPIALIIPADRQTEESELLGRIRAGTRIEHYETVRQRKDGTPVDVSLTISPVKDERGRITGASKIARDVGGRKAAEAALRLSEERFRLLAENVPVGIFLSDERGACVFVNEQWSAMSGLAAAEARGDGWARAVHPDDRDAVLAGWHAAVKSNEPSTAEFRFLRPDGQVVWLHGNAVPFRDGDRFRGYLGSCVDITARKLAEQQATFLHDLADQLGAAESTARILELAAAALGRHLAADRCLFLELGERVEQGDILLEWAKPGVPDLAGRFPFAQVGMLLTRPRSQVADVRAHRATQSTADTFTELGIRSLAASTYWQHGRWRLTVAVTSATPRTWQPFETELLEQAVARTWSLVERARALAALKASESRWRQLAEAMPNLVWSCRGDGLHDFMSPQWTRYTGRTELELLGDGWAEVVHPDDLESVSRRWQAALASGEPYDNEVRIRSAAGEYRWFKIRAVPVRDETGRVVRWYGSNTDVEGLRRAERAVRESEQQVRLVADHAPIFLAQLDREHRYKFVNQPYADRHQRDREDIIGRQVAELTGAAAYEVFRPHLERALEGVRVEFEQEIPYERLGRTWVHVIYEPERDAEGRVIGLIAVIMDVTARKRTEQELERARDEAVAASRAKDDFLAALSHELRTPLSPVLLLASDAAGNPNLPREVRENFELIRANISLEARLIDDLLDLTRITRGKMTFDRQRVDLHEVLRDALSNIQGELDGKRLHLSVSLAATSAEVQGDPVRLQQVLWNVLKNAVKFTDPEGRVQVTTRDAGGQVIVQVADTGIGMTRDELDRVFDAFVQGDHANAGLRRFGGLGLGLAISRRLVELHGGRIQAESPGRNCGSVFTIELPALGTADHGTTAGPPKAQPEAPPGRGPVRLLLVEDHVATRETLERLLSRRGYAVVAVGTAAEARLQMVGQEFEVFVSDVGLPDGDGYELMGEFRRIHPQVPGIAVSGYGMEDDLQRSQAAGFAVHLVKPVSVSVLEAAIRQLLPRPAGGPPQP